MERTVLRRVPRVSHRVGAKRNHAAVLNCADLALKQRPMPDPKLLEEISAKFAALLAASPAKDVEKNFRALLAATLARFDLATREEFDVQRELLARTREKLVTLEARVAELEGKLGHDG